MSMLLKRRGKPCKLKCPPPLRRQHAVGGPAQLLRKGIPRALDIYARRASAPPDLCDWAEKVILAQKRARCGFSRDRSIPPRRDLVEGCIQFRLGRLRHLLRRLMPRMQCGHLHSPSACSHHLWACGSPQP
eukprot:scaffold4781_cov102-Isochrysis_galbana.AAC.2